MQIQNKIVENFLGKIKIRFIYVSSIPMNSMLNAGKTK